MPEAATRTECAVQAGAPTRQFVRCLHAATFVGIWMIIGWVFRLGGNSYLVVGVPLVVLFQLLVRRKPLTTLWIRDAGRFRLGPLGIVFGVGMAILPSSQLIQTIRSADRWSHIPEILWYLCCIIGAFGAAFAFCRFSKWTWKELGFCMLTAGVIGCGTMVLGALLRSAISHASVQLNGGSAVTALQSFALYVPVCFVLEEVVFRGAIDSHVFQPGDKGHWWTALFVSTMWGWWHLPIVGVAEMKQLITLIVLLPCIHIAVGVFLSLSWRRSGNLAVPATVHAFIDAVRNMLM